VKYEKSPSLNGLSFINFEPTALKIFLVYSSRGKTRKVCQKKKTNGEKKRPDGRSCFYPSKTVPLLPWGEKKSPNATSQAGHSSPLFQRLSPPTEGKESARTSSSLPFRLTRESSARGGEGEFFLLINDKFLFNR